MLKSPEELEQVLSQREYFNNGDLEFIFFRMDSVYLEKYFQMEFILKKHGKLIFEISIPLEWVNCI